MKKNLKQVADSLFLCGIIPLFLLHRLCSIVGNRDASFWAFSQFLSLFPGRAGSYIRKTFYRLSMAHCARDCAILFGTIFSHADTEIASGVYIGPQCNIGKCIIEAHCTIGSGVHIMSGRKQHNFNDLTTPIQEQGGVFEKVTIGENTWIGNCALIMADIGKQCIVGAGSVVTKAMPDYSIIAGNPARVVRSRLELTDE
ncbi:MAG: acyltransferase [Desulfatiglans sp.]|jgi:acetyltransferase-like isoleucine patch superfamily enzyme|nr:acyltransferase [Desulfatiglans sp.]